MIIAYIYNKRLEKPILYAAVLLLFMNISLHTLVLSGSLYLLFLIDLYKSKKIKEKKNVIACILIFLELLITMLYAMPNKDCSFIARGGATIWHIVSEATMGSNQSEYIDFLITFIIGIAITFAIIKNKSKENLITLIILLIPVIGVLSIVTYQPWHVGIIFITLFTYFIITNMLQKEKIIQYLLLIISIVQIYWTACSIIYDVNYLYSSSKVVANIIKENYEGSVIYGLGYSTTAIQPYFNKNIFENRNTDKSFNLWKINNGYYTKNEMIQNEADVYVISTFYILYYKDVMNILDAKGYNKYMINGCTFVKDKKYELEGYIIYTK